MDFITKTDAISLLGVTISQFSKLNIKPAKVKPNPYRSSEKMYLYDACLIKDLSQSDLIKSLIRTKKERKDKDYISLFKKRNYKNDQAIKLAAEYMFNLNRYVKTNKCSSNNKIEIYEIKNKFIEFLYMAISEQGHPEKR